MEKRIELIQRITGLEGGIKEEDIVVPFGYDLYSDDRIETCDGIVCVTKDSVICWENGSKVFELSLSEIGEFKCRTGIGCAFVEYVMADGETDKGGDRILCRGTMTYARLFAALCKRLNRWRKGESFDYGYEEELDLYCPKCGRPYRPGSRVCDHCVDKKQYVSRLWAIAKPQRFLIYISVAMYFVIAAVNLLGPMLNRVLVDDYIMAESKPLLAKFAIVILMMLGLNVVQRLLSITRSLILVSASNKIVVRLRQLVFGKIQEMSIARISKRTAGELMNRVTGDTSVVNNFLTRQIGDCIEQAVTLIAVAIFIFTYDWKLALMIILPAPAVIAVNKAFWKYMHHRWHRQWMDEEHANSILHDIFSGIRVVKAFGMEKYEGVRYDESITTLRDTSIKNEAFFAVYNPILNFFMGIGQFFLLYYAGSHIISGEMTLGYMMQLTSYISLIYGPLMWISNLPRQIVRLTTSIVKIFDVIDEKSDVADAADAKEIEVNGNIDIEGASFGYDEAVDVLKDINLHIKPGEMIGIVGRSGVGKSTLINLVMRLYDVDEGCIKIDGTDIREISQDSLRSQIGVVLQETFLFSGTIYENIAYAKVGATYHEVITAAKLAGAHEFIMRLPDAYNTKVGERGHTLSGGERQRVAIARALLHDPRILILDEATSSLDTETEKQIQDSLQLLIKDRTTLAIAHRLSTLRNATRLVVLDKGTVAEVGTHDELMRKKGIYYGLVMAQRQMSKVVKD